jgi:hypothetical protein
MKVVEHRLRDCCFSRRKRKKYLKLCQQIILILQNDLLRSEDKVKQFCDRFLPLSPNRRESLLVQFAAKMSISQEEAEKFLRLLAEEAGLVRPPITKRWHHIIW